MNKKIAIGAIILIIVLAIGAGVWRWENKRKEEMVQNQAQIKVNENVQKKENNTTEITKNGDDIRLPNTEDWRSAEWLTYTDKKNGFEIKYPNSFYLDKSQYINDPNYHIEDVEIRHIDTVRYIKEMGGYPPETNNVVKVDCLSRQYFSFN